MLGQRLGHYLIEQKLGEGGMGVVYRARDEKLQRDVALKFLETLPSGNSASHERALQEARAISALNHPNICTVYEVGEVEGQAVHRDGISWKGGRLAWKFPPTGLSLWTRWNAMALQLADALAACAQPGCDSPRPESRERHGHSQRPPESSRFWHFAAV